MKLRSALLAAFLLAPPARSDEPKPAPAAPPTFAELDKARDAIKSFNDALEKRGLPPLDLGRPGPPGPAGPPGKDGAMGPMPDHEVDGKRIRFQRPGGVWGPWIDLGGNPDPPPPPQPTGKVARFVVVEDTSKAGAWRGTILGSPKVRAFYEQLQGARSGAIHRLIDVNAAGDDVVAQAYKTLAAGKALPWLWLLDDSGKILKDLACPTATPEAFIAAFELAQPKRALGLKLAKPRLKWTEFGSTPNTPLIPRMNWKPVDLSAFLPPVHDQDGIGQCASSSACTVLEACRRQAGLPYVYLSAGDLYGRVNGGRDDGSLLEDNMAEMSGGGVAPVSASSPYLWRRGQTAPASTRAPYRVVEAYLCTSFDAMASAVQQGFVVQTGLLWYPNFEPDRNGRLPKRGVGSPGGHALCVAGIEQWEDGTWSLILRNSWGPGFGRAGNCSAPENLFDNEIGGWWALRAVVQTPNDFPAPSATLRKKVATDSAFVLAP